MPALKNLFVIVDPTVERDFVVERAKHVARLSNAAVKFYVNNSNSLTDRSYTYEGIGKEFFATQKKLFQEHFQRLLNDLVAEFMDEGIEASANFGESHNLAESIIARVQAEKPDLVLKSTHHHGALERALVTNTDWRLIRKCPAPLLLAKPDQWSSEGCIVTAVDPLHVKAEQARLDALLLRVSHELAHELDSPLRVFHSYFPFSSSLFPLGGESAEHLSRIRHQHEEKVFELVKKFGISTDSVHLSQGELAPALTGYLEESNANMLVIGALSRNAVERAIVGNTAEKILENCPCDVLVLKSPREQ